MQLSVRSRKWLGICGYGFWLRARREEEAYPYGSVVDEQRRTRAKAAPPGGLSYFRDRTLIEVVALRYKV
ncbi:MAG: hypothetical protein DME55_03995 [Verrucomicrobia bacterium]|nr:MAG: hypothetical protein DME55_03995 [Verrucomicrobiota bacterium]